MQLLCHYIIVIFHFELSLCGIPIDASIVKTKFRLTALWNPTNFVAFNLTAAFSLPLIFFFLFTFLLFVSISFRDFFLFLLSTKLRIIFLLNKFGQFSPKIIFSDDIFPRRINTNWRVKSMAITFNGVFLLKLELSKRKMVAFRNASLQQIRHAD